MDNYSTDDCKKILNVWIVDNGHNSSGKWKRLNKSKNEQGQWVRIFEYSVDSLILNVIETDSGLVVQEPIKVNYPKAGTYGEAEDSPEDYYFSISNQLDETFNKYHHFFVVEKDYFDTEGGIDCVNYSDYHFMPEVFEEVEESSFIIHKITVSEARKILKSMGFTENKKINELFD